MRVSACGPLVEQPAAAHQVAVGRKRIAVTTESVVVEASRAARLRRGAERRPGTHLDTQRITSNWGLRGRASGRTTCSQRAHCVSDGTTRAAAVGAAR